MPRIQQVTMRNFRGAAASSAITFDRKPLILIFGENGTGKSTIVDAIDLVCNEGYGTVDERSSTTRKDHLPTIGTRPAQVEVQIEFDSGTWTGTLNAAGKAQIRPDHLRPTVRVLRRRSLLKLTEDTPGDRYKQLQSLIDVRQMEQAEAQLKLAAEQVKKRLDDAASTIRNAQGTLDALWKAEGNPAPDALTWAQARTGTDEATLRAEVEQVHTQFDRLSALRTAQTNFDQAHQHSVKAQAALDAFEDQLREQGQALSTDLARLLQDTQTYLRLAQPDQCPTCQQAINPDTLQRELQARLDASHHLNDLNVQRQQAQQRQMVASQAQKTAEKALTAAQAAAGQPLVTEQEVQQIGANLDSLRRSLESHTALTYALSVMQTTRSSALQDEATASRLRTMHETLRQTRVEFTQAIFDQVSAETQRLYQRIHPSEPIGLSGIHLDPDRRASLHQKATFHGHDDVTPQGFYSEAHLDTLGFCFWLAVIKHTTPNAIIVLDDVFTSVDAAHLNRIDQMLLDEATSGALSQIIVITHYRGWLDKLRSAMPDDVDTKELGRWTLAHGINVRGVTPHTHELRALSENPFLDRQAVASKAGVLLEAMLDHLTLAFNLSLPRHPQNKYTLGPLLNAVAKETRTWHTTRPGHPPQPWQPTLDRLKALTFIRNEVGAHFNLTSADITDHDIREFASATLALADLLLCPTCGRRAYSKTAVKNPLPLPGTCGGSCKQTHLTPTAPTTVPTPAPAGQ
ncbi:AAA domain-containing protein [Deinococcus reticulitermitis]|uniref:AAA domain-containing protein n=1 Tax=Deinococcus reticulitermitis TaxID=856736 RepID=A0A1H6VC19_9DEIO|nr:AAA family ATPase [Deinococcus reticulitermitis]SEI98170.1 AAA domain-containing protein [Deinococcus reticulitermitis]